ncbi:MAG: MotA/TolQ/ExbB proton channel family protein [Desulfococcaceae bacterium]
MIPEFLEKIGPAGVALFALSGFGLYFALRNTLYLFLVERDFRRRFAGLENGDPAYRRQVCEATDNPLIGIVSEIVRTHATHSKDIRAEVAYMFHRNFESVNRGLTYLRLISVIAPLLGLLGTMLGMVAVFRNIAADAATDSALLAAGIWEALLTTILGLCVAIPTLVFYYHLTLKVRGFRIEAVEHSYRAVELTGITCAESEPSPERRENSPEPERRRSPRAPRPLGSAS